MAHTRRVEGLPIVLSEINTRISSDSKTHRARELLQRAEALRHELDEVDQDDLSRLVSGDSPSRLGCPATTAAIPIVLVLQQETGPCRRYSCIFVNRDIYG